MKRVKRTEITIETDEILIVSDGETFEATAHRWCPRCGTQVEMAQPGPAARSFSISVREVFRLIEAGLAHFQETTQGTLLVCLPSVSAGPAPEAGPAEETFNSDHEGEKTK
jgi:hypothetical protein